jgi:UDP-N-acetylglucosamine-lysosomal-enzyme
MGRLLKIIKTGQRRIYDFLLTKYGLALVVIGIFVILFSLIQLSDTILEYRLAQLKRLANSINLKNTSIVLELNYNKYNDEKHNQESDLNYADDDSNDYRYFKSNIDVVYTWVNGSDPEHLKQLRHFKMTNSQNSNRQNNSFIKIELKDFLQKNLDSDNWKDIKFPCYHKLCIQTNNLIVIVPQLKPVDKQTFLIKAKHSFDSNFYSNLSIFNFHSNHNLPLSVVHINSPKIYTNKSLLNDLNMLFAELNEYKFYMAYYTIDCSLSVNCITNLNRTFVAKRLNQLPHTKKNPEANSNNLNGKYLNNRLSGLNISNEPLATKINNLDASQTDPQFELELPKYVQDNLIHKYDYAHLPFSFYDGSSEVNKQEKDDKKSTEPDKSSMSTYLSVFTVNSRELEKNLSKYLNEGFETDQSNNMRKRASKLFSFNDKTNRNISYDLYRANIVWDLGDPFAEDVAENRFFDNDELKYSMKSIEKHAPWIRNVYLVTNGQVPNWLNLSHPKIKLITHEQIFLNKSHLPTFSSPAIESHLHRIKGLSKRFLYFNDDVLLTKTIWPDDFFTKSRGFKIHLAWALPGCNPNCPNNWIRDGYCDKACNTTECEYDGGDCTKIDTKRSHYDNARLSLMNETQKLFPDFFCSPGCSTSWLADKYCDNACNTLNCAFDMGDCGIENFEEKIFGIDLFDTNSITQFPIRKIINIPTETLSFYVKFNKTFENGLKFRIIKAQYEEDKKIRTMSAVNKYGILTVLLMPSAYSETIKSNDVLKVYIDGTFLNEIESETKPLQVNLTINLNALKKVNTTTRVTINNEIDQQNLKNEVSSKPIQNQIIEKYTVKFDQVQPKLITINADTSRKVIDLYPQNLKFSHKFLETVYENYFNYLNWSLSNEYLSQAGFEYKLNLFYSKLTNEINQTYINLLANSDLSNHDYGILNQILLNNQTHLIDEADKYVFINRYLQESANSTFRFRKRKLLDTFADSLRYVNRLFNQVYGYVPRKVPAHMPHFIDKHIMNDLQSKFKNQFEKTSANRLRTTEDMQFAFTYNYFLMSELVDFNASVLFDELDLNSNGYFDHFEIITINLRMSSRSFSSSDFIPHQAPASEMYKLNIDLSTTLNECIQNRSEKSDNRLSKASFLLCKSLVDLLREHFWNNADFEEAKGRGIRYKYKFHTVGDEETKFVMIGGDPLEIEVKLNNLIREPRKFICLNDNIDYKLKHHATELKRLLANFYSNLFPLKSSFEKKSNENSDHFSSSHENKLKQHHIDLGNEEGENFSEKFDNKSKLIVKLTILVATLILVAYVLTRILRCLRNVYSYLIYLVFKQKTKGKRREHKISNAFRKRMEMEASSSDTCTEEHEKSSLSQSNLSAQSIASALRAKNFSSFNRKSNKKSPNTTII